MTVSAHLFGSTHLHLFFVHIIPPPPPLSSHLLALGHLLTAVFLIKNKTCLPELPPVALIFPPGSRVKLQDIVDFFPATHERIVFYTARTVDGANMTFVCSHLQSLHEAETFTLGG